MDITAENKTIGELLREGQKEISGAAIEESKEECERILMSLLGCVRSALYLNTSDAVTPKIWERFLRIIEEREKRVPLAYLLGEADFWKETLYVNEHCLIPRPETETLIEAVKKLATVTIGDCHQPLSFLDIGTGSGAISAALLREMQNARGTLLDISADALEVARTNIEKYGLGERAKLVRGDLFSPFGAEEKWDLIVSNPPYLSEKDFETLQPEIGFEPRAALDGGKDGLDFYRRLIPGAKKHLNAGGILALEVGAGQAQTVSKWLQDAGYDNIQRFKDYLGIERAVIARFS